MGHEKYQANISQTYRRFSTEAWHVHQYQFAGNWVKSYFELQFKCDLE
jgi:hypothetical protein